MKEIKQHPLIIVFYLDAEMMKVRDIIVPFTEAINQMLTAKEANALAFFIPTTGIERIECINPVVVSPIDMDKIMTTINDITKSFDIGGDVNLPDTEITLDECVCNGGSCQCKQ